MVTPSGVGRAVVRYVVLSLILVAMVFPLVWMLAMSLLPPGELRLARLVSEGITLANYVDLFASGRLGLFLLNSAIVGIVVTAGNILFCFMTGYAMARYRTLGQKLLFVGVIVVLMIPAHITIIPLYFLTLKSGLYDTYAALILPFLVNPIGIFLVKQYVENIPPSMEEAARIDGASELRIVFQVVMPLCRPALAVLAIQVFFTNWNSFLFPFILTSRDSLRTLPVGLALLQGHQAIDWPHLMAGSAVAVIPVLVLFVFVQRQIVAGITAGAVKQ